MTNILMLLPIGISALSSTLFSRQLLFLSWPSQLLWRLCPPSHPFSVHTFESLRDLCAQLRFPCLLLALQNPVLAIWSAVPVYVFPMDPSLDPWSPSVHTFETLRYPCAHLRFPLLFLGLRKAILDTSSSNGSLQTPLQVSLCSPSFSRSL